MLVSCGRRICSLEHLQLHHLQLRAQTTSLSFCSPSLFPFFSFKLGSVALQNFSVCSFICWSSFFFLSFTIQSWSIQFTSNLIEFNEFSINEIIWGRGGGQVVSRSGSETRYPRFNRSGFHFFKKIYNLYNFSPSRKRIEEKNDLSNAALMLFIIGIVVEQKYLCVKIKNSLCA